MSLVVLNFILVIYINATQLTYSLIGILDGHGQKGHVNKVFPSSVQKLSWNCLFSFFWNSTCC